MIIQAEVIVARNLSLKSKFTDSLLERQDAAEELQHFVASILQNSEVMVRGGPMGPAGTAIQKLFLAAQKVGVYKLFEETIFYIKPQNVFSKWQIEYAK